MDRDRETIVEVPEEKTNYSSGFLHSSFESLQVELIRFNWFPENRCVAHSLHPEMDTIESFSHGDFEISELLQHDETSNKWHAIDFSHWEILT